MAISKDIAIISFHCFRCSKAYLRKSIDLQLKQTPLKGVENLYVKRLFCVAVLSFYRNTCGACGVDSQGIDGFTVLWQFNMCVMLAHTSV